MTGYFSPPIEALISTSGTSMYSGSPRVLSSSQPTTGTYVVTLDTDVTYCSPVATPYYYTNYYASVQGFTGNQVTIRVWTLDSTTHLPVPVNDYVYLTVTC